MNYEAWRITFQDSEQAARSMYDAYQKLESDNKALVDKYYDLIMCVGNKYPGESRHETAKRYIVQAENRSNAPSQAKHHGGAE